MPPQLPQPPLAAVGVDAVVVLEQPAVVAVAVVALAGLYVPAPSQPAYDPDPLVFGPISNPVLA